MSLAKTEDAVRRVRINYVIMSSGPVSVALSLDLPMTSGLDIRSTDLGRIYNADFRVPFFCLISLTGVQSHY